MHDAAEPLAIGSDAILVQGAREHNLKNISVSIPRGKLVVVTGVSGSGKSTLAFDLLFAEGQRRFLDCMSTYARQFVEQMARPDVDLIAGLPPTVSIEQRVTRGGGKSTVATVTEIHHFLRLLFSRLGTPFCPECQLPVQGRTRDGVGQHLLDEARRRGDLLLLAPVVRHRKGFHSEIAEWAARHGYAEVRADGRMYPTDKPLRLDRFREHDVEIVIGILDKPRATPRRAEGLPRKATATTATTGPSPQQLIDEALEVGKGTVLALDNRGKITVHSTERACPQCGRSIQPLDPKHFSYNSSQGWCPRCRGFGELFYLPDAERGARADAIEESWWSWQEGKREPCPDCQGARLNPLARTVRLLLGPAAPTKRRAKALGQTEAPTIDTIGSMSVNEALRWVESLHLESREAQIARDILPEIRSRLAVLGEIGLGYLQLHRSVPTLSGGEGQRIRLAAQLGSNLSGVLYVLDEPTIGLHARDNLQLLDALDQLKRRGNSLVVVEHDEDTMRRADFIIDLGPGAGVQGGQIVAAGTLSELATHPESVTGQCLREHRRFPTRGERRPVPPLLAASPATPSTPARRASSKIPARTKSKDAAKTHSMSAALAPTDAALPATNRLATRTAGSDPTVTRNASDPAPQAAAEPPFPGWLTLNHASVHNLKDLTVSLPLGRFIVVTGVSGSGKSTLVRECLLPSLEMALSKNRGRAPRRPAREEEPDDDAPKGPATAPQPRRATAATAAARSAVQGPMTLTGAEGFQAVYEVDQTPIGRTPRSTPATYVGFFDDIRALFAQVPEARMRGYGAGRFSFNSAAGRCPQCAGAGEVKIEMNFLPTAYVRCEVCKGTRFNPETLDIEYAGRNIAQILELSVNEAIPFFEALPRIRRPLEALQSTGLGYLKLGQTSPTLSGGEAQRVKLVTHLLTGLKDQDDRLERFPRRNIFILEEPTIGLHMADVRRLVDVIQRLVDHGHTVIVIEHNLDLVAEADWVLDLGPEAGAAGGRLVVQGTPETVAAHPHSHTGRFLRPLLTASQPPGRKKSIPGRGHA